MPSRQRPLWVLLIMFGPVVPLMVLTSRFLTTHGRIVIALWCVYGVIFFIALVAVETGDRRRRLRKHRLDFGLCLECGYRLRGVSGRCPECGTPIQTDDDSSQRGQ